jgi:hypothetical protein
MMNPPNNIMIGDSILSEETKTVGGDSICEEKDENGFSDTEFCSPLFTGASPKRWERRLRLMTTAILLVC